MHFMLLIRTVPFIRTIPFYLSLPLGPRIGVSPRDSKKTLLQEGLAAKSPKTAGNGSFLLQR